MYLAELTTQEVERLDRDLPVIVPFGAFEQHGPHLPLGTDAWIAEAVVKRLDARHPERQLWLPVQFWGASVHHLQFPGTITLSSRTFLDAAREVVASLRAHRFRRFLLFNAHGGNQALLDVAVQEIRAGTEVHPPPETTNPARRDVWIAHVTYWAVAAEAFARIRETPAGGMGHAGEMETSILLALRPDLVRKDKLEAGGQPPRSALDHHDMLRPAKVGQFLWWRERSANGVLGDPRSASREKGERFLEAAADALAEAVEALREGRIG